MANENENINNIPTSIEPGDLSALLVEYRETANLSVDQIAEALCLSPNSIKALEAEDFDRLPEPPYVRGYLRSYARFAEQDSTRIINVYNSLRGEPTPDYQTQALNVSANSDYNTVSKPLITPQRFRLGLLAALLLLLAILSMVPGVRDWAGGLWSSFSDESSTTTAVSENTQESSQTGLPSLTGELPGNLPIDPDAKAETEEASTTDETPAAETQQENAEESEAVTTEETKNNEESADNEKADEDATASTEEESAPEGDTNLKFTFKEQVWMRIQDASGKTVFQGLNPAGTEKELSLNSPLKFRVGNAQGMTLFVNGKEMDTSEFVKGSVANFGIE